HSLVVSCMPLISTGVRIGYARQEDRRSNERLKVGDPVVVDVSFPLRGTSIPPDHGYAPYGAIAAPVPRGHRDGQVGTHPIRGHPTGQRRLALDSGSHLVVRLPVARVPDILPLAGKQLDLRGDQLRLGMPSSRPLEPAPSLVSRLVVIKGFTESDVFLDA